jgi:hypothetical protein
MIKNKRGGIVMEEWISVKDRLPKDKLGDFTFVVMTNGIKAIIGGYWSYDKTFYKSLESGRSVEYKGVTYYIEIPRLPKKYMAKR